MAVILPRINLYIRINGSIEGEMGVSHGRDPPMNQHPYRIVLLEMPCFHYPVAYVYTLFD